MDSKESVFEAWAPHDAVWSAWAKPVLFAHLPRRLPEVSLEVGDDLEWVPPPERGCALLVELPGAQSAAAGISLAERGYRPVPLFNACPPPERDEWFQATETKPVRAAVDVESILAAIVLGADRLTAVELGSEAPPAFLLDALRKTPQQPLQPGHFDNRSVLFTTDLPSAVLLQSRGIRKVVVVTREDGRLPDDLQHLLRTWSHGGLSLARKSLDRPGPPQPFTLPAPSFLRGLWIRLAAWLGMARNPEGGFGGFIPEVSGS